MRFTLNWLKEFLDTDKNLEEICHSLTSIGLEVEDIIDRREELKDFVVAQINDCKPHPNAEKLQICDVFDGKENLQIVCGAPNARKGIKVVLAKIGLEIPCGKFKIKKSSIRGIESNGMLCSESELIIGNDTAGIIELPEFANIGESFISYYGLDDPVIELSITPNRSDCFGVYGIARDLAAYGVGSLKKLNFDEMENSFDSDFNLEIQEYSDCEFLTFREIRNIKNTESPKWLKNYLKNIGMEPISAVVDITNYVNISFARPTHAYDKDKLEDKKLIAGFLDINSEYLALNGKSYKINDKDFLIHDAKRPLSLAGVIGFENTKCENHTKNIILESAYFSQSLIAKSGRRHNIITDSRHRFERGVDKDFVIKGLDIITFMILKYCGGEASNILISGKSKIEKENINFDPNLLEKMTGIKIEEKNIENILTKLGYEFSKINQNNWSILVPSWRHDIKIPENIVEDILRIYGFDKIDRIKLYDLENRNYRILEPSQRRKYDLKRAVSSCGYYELVTWSFMPSEFAKYFADYNSNLHIVNPISSDMDYMRPSIIPNLLDAILKNESRSIFSSSFFELGPIFEDSKDSSQYRSLAGVISGFKKDKDIYSDAKKIDVLDIKGDLELIFSQIDFDFSNIQIDQDVTLSYYHPKKSASIKLGKNILGYFGEIHPNIIKKYGIRNRVCAFEIYIDRIPIQKSKFGKKAEIQLSKYQVVNRDFAFIFNEKIRVGDLLNFIKKISPIVTSVDLFDIYKGEKIEEGKKSVAFSVAMQSNEKTLSDLEIEEISSKIIENTSSKFGGVLREI